MSKDDILRKFLNDDNVDTIKGEDLFLLIAERIMALEKYLETGTLVNWKTISGETTSFDWRKSE